MYCVVPCSQPLQVTCIADTAEQPPKALIDNAEKCVDMIKNTHVFLRVFMGKRTSRIWVFLAFRPRRKRLPVCDKIRKYRLSRYYHVSSNKLLPHF